MKVQYSYLKEQFKDSKEIFDGLKNQLKRCEFTFGRELEQFEKSFAHYVGAKYALGVGSGTDALKLSLKALGIGPGDEVITVSQTFIATVGAIVEVGATPVFVDVTPEFIMDIDRIESAITSRTKAILPVHYSGNPVEMQKLMVLAKEKGLFVIEDACCAIGARVWSQHVGTFGDCGAFSLHPLKNLNVWGDGGVVVTNDEKTYEKLKLLRNHGLSGRDDVPMFGYNSRLDTIQAIVGNHLIKRVDEITNQRRSNAAYYDRELSRIYKCTFPHHRDTHKKHVYHMYMFYAERRDDLLKYLIKNGIEAKVHYPKAVHMQDCYKNSPYAKKYDLGHTELQCKSIISLPVHQHLTTRQLDYVIKKIKEFYKC